MDDQLPAARPVCGVCPYCFHIPKYDCHVAIAENIAAIGNIARRLAALEIPADIPAPLGESLSRRTALVAGALWNVAESLAEQPLSRLPLPPRTI